MKLPQAPVKISKFESQIGPDHSLNIKYELTQTMSNIQREVLEFTLQYVSTSFYVSTATKCGHKEALDYYIKADSSVVWHNNQTAQAWSLWTGSKAYKSQSNAPLRQVKLENEIKEVTAEIDILIESLASINFQLDAAKAGKKINNIEADPDWFSRASYSKRMKGIEHQKLIAKRAELNKELKQLKSLDSNGMLLEIFKAIVAKDIGDTRCFDLFGLALREKSLKEANNV